jgi:hypothetical protein
MVEVWCSGRAQKATQTFSLGWSVSFMVKEQYALQSDSPERSQFPSGGANIDHSSWSIFIAVEAFR